MGAPTNYTYDMLGRQTSMLHPGGATETTAYFGDRATVTDPAGKTKSYNYDALGRLVKVIEHPNEPESTADYGYDALDNLISVKHGRHPNYQHRSFIYDSLSRLVEAKNPESEKVEYAYDAVGNLIRRTDNRLINTTYVYDKLNRLREKKYSDATPPVSYMYDDVDVPNSKGRLTRINNVKSGSNLSTTNMTAYDALGRVTASSQTTNGRDYKFTYTYNLAGALTSETYPSGRKVETSYDAVNRPITVQSSGLPYLTDVQYAPHGSPSQYRYGNNLLRSITYNNRLQTAAMKDSVQEVALWNASLNFGAANNNGNLQSETTVQQVSGPPGNPRYPLTFQTTYGYDSLNRLTNVAATGFNIRYGYDAWNNMWVTEPPAFSANGLTPRDNVYEATNRMRGLTYDPAGNLQSYGAKSIVYDAENKQSTVTESAAAGGGQVSYAYDGNGQRVMKTMNADSTVYVYDIFGHLAAEYTNYAVEPPPCTTCYLSVDHLGTTRLVTDAAANVVSRHDYLPFGEEIPAGPGGRTSEWGSTTDVRHKFTGKERDRETGLDYFGARYMSSAQGRFMSPDEPLADQQAMDPQSWNLYAYVRNNPLKNIDPTGGACFDGTTISSCGNYILGGLMAIGNTPSDIINAPNRLTNALISPFTAFRFPDAIPQTFTATTIDQQEGMQVAEVVMMVSPAAEVGAGKVAEAIGMGARIEASAVAAVQETGTIYKLPAQEGSGKPYVGRAVDVDKRMATRRDGRLGPAEPIDTFNAQERAHGQYKEQKAINAHGGIKNLDNKRNEVNLKRYEELKKKYEKQP